MKKRKDLTTTQRERALIKLIKDAEELGFNGDLVLRYKAQLNQVQEEIKRDKEILKSRSIERRLY